MAYEISIVIPAFNESQRLPSTLEALTAFIQAMDQNLAIIQEILIVDDGSSDTTIQTAEKFKSMLPQLRVIPSTQNFGKGHAIRLGLFEAKAPWVLIADADMSTPWGELLKLVQKSQTGKAEICIGSRDIEGSNILTHQSILRESLGKSFNYFVRALTGLKFKDTQCGFKLVNRLACTPFLKRLEINRFAWDVEFLVFAQSEGLKILEVPVTWAHKDESRVHPIYDGMNMLWTVLKLRTRI